MDGVSKDLISILQYLLPGFVSAWIFYTFTSHEKPSQFERVVQALIFTLFVQVFLKLSEAAYGFIKKWLSWGTWTDQIDLIGSIVFAVILGFLFAFFTNNDTFHGLIRKMKISTGTSYPSEWFGAFKENITYAVLHLHDERRLYGWVKEWPSSPTNGHFMITQPSWLDDKEPIDIEGVEHVLIAASDVRWIEFMKKTWENSNDKEKT